MSETIQIIAAITGLVGAIGGILISYLTLRHTFRKDRHTIKLEIAKSILAWPQPGTTKPRFDKDQLTFSVANVGAKEFTVVSVGLKVGRRSGGRYLNQPFGTVTVPHKLQPDETCNFWTDYKKITKGIEKPKLYNKIKGYVSDYLGNAFYSNSLTVVLRESRRDKVWSWIKKQTKDFLTLLRP